MSRVNSEQSFTAFTSMSSCFTVKANTSPLIYGLVCLVSGLAASFLLGLVFPSYAEEDDIRSFGSFAVGAFVCCHLLKQIPCASSTKAPKTLDDTVVHQKYIVPYRAANGRAAPARQLKSPPVLERRASNVGSSASAGHDICAFKRVTAVLPPPVVAEPIVYSAQRFRKAIVAIMKDLALHKNVARAVGQVRDQNVPVDRQASEFANILTFAVEECRGNVRRTFVAFVGGLAGAFDKAECLMGIGQFFDGYEELCDEVAKLSRLIKIEVVPILNSVLPAEHVKAFLPEAVIECQ